MTEKTQGLIEKFAENYSVEPSKLMITLKATAFKVSTGEISNEQMMALLVVADQYGLNPFTKEIYAFPDKRNGIIPVVGVDGWSRIINSNPYFDGIEFTQSESLVAYPDGGSKSCPEWIECIIYRKDRTHPIKIREYLDEVFRPPIHQTGNNGGYVINTPWQTHTKRMLRWKAMIQCARIAFGFAGIYDIDEAERIIESNNQNQSSKPSIDIDLSDSSSELNGDFNESESIDAEFVEVKNIENDYASGSQNTAGTNQNGHSFIDQLINFAKENNSWDTTLDNLKERYSGETLELAEKNY
ncbi:phage recombination protein Bet [Psychromonas sp. KJ10-2]|uniref:phage recombination protein Bet n=1 Tax=Psychromonas sp. KJ10-2 TaxID=3391822 RepID=UPI0039B484A4